MKAFFTFSFLIISLLPDLKAQVISVIDEEDMKAVPEVVIMNSNGTEAVYTTRAGTADITVFGKNETICFQSFTYERICLTAEDIKKMGYVVKLKKNVFALEEFVVSATRWEENIKDIPNKIMTVSKPSIELYNPQTSADLVALTGGVFIQKSQQGGGSPMIRGFATNRVLIVVDGVRINNAIYREGNIHNIISVDPAAIETSEVIFGPGAIVYGSDAIGGVMDFHTAKPLFSTTSKALIRADAMTRYSSASDEKSIHAGFNIAKQRWSFLTSLSYNSYGDLRMGSHNNPAYLRPEYATRVNNKDTVVANADNRVQRFSNYKQFSALNKLRIKLGENSTFEYSFHYSDISDIPRYDRLIQYKSGKLRYGDWYYGPQTWIMNSLQLTGNRETRFFSKAKVTAAFQNYRESRHDRAFGNPEINEQFEKVGIFSLNADLDKKLTGDSYLFYGTEFYFNGIESEAQTRDIISGVTAPAGSRYPNGDNSYLGFSVYTGYKNVISDKYTFTGGLRYNYNGLWSTIADNSWYNFPFTSFSITNGALTGAAGIVIRPEKNMQINLNGSTGFRAPNLDDAGKVFDSAPGVVVVPNPGLEPEYAYNADAGFAWEYGDIFHADITGFFTFLKNAMVRDDFLFNGNDSIMYGGEMSKVEAMTNAGSATVYGFQANVRINVARCLKLTSVFNFTEGREDNGAYLRHAAPIFGDVHLVFEKKKLRSDLYLIYNGARTYEKMPPSELEKAYLYASDENGNPWSPGWATLNFKVSYTISGRIVINGGVENILDNRYRPYSSGIAAPGRNFILSLRVAV